MEPTENVKKKKKSVNKIFLIASIVVILFGIGMIIHDSMFINAGEKIDAEVNEVKITYSRDIDGRTKSDEDIYVDYEYNGEKYEHVLINHRRSDLEYREGELIEIYVDPDDPINIADYTTPFSGIIVILFGAVFLIPAFR